MGNNKPDSRVLLAFFAIVLLLGVNFVAVRFSNRELPPFWGATLRFAIASALLFCAALVRRVSLPKGKALAGAALFGALAFGVNFGLLYWGLLRVPAGMASVLFATLPLTTMVIATALGQEKMRIRGVIGALGALVGITIVFAEQLRFDVPIASMVAVLLATVAAALSGIVVKGFPRNHPVMANAVGMGVAAVILFTFSVAAREQFALPSLGATWAALAYLIFSSCVAFVLYVWVLERWTASATAYTTVLFPLVTVTVAAVLAGESVTPLFLVGSALALVGVYYGALSKSK